MEDLLALTRDRKKLNDEGIALKSGIWYVISSIMVKAIAIISTPLFTRLMTTEEYGTIATFVSWYSLILTFCTLNLTYSIGRAKLDYPTSLKEYIGSMQLLSACVTAIIIILSIVLLKPLSFFLELSPIFVILLLLYLFFTPTIQFVQNGYRYQYKYKQNIAIAWYVSISTVVLSLILMLTVPGNKAVLRAYGIVIPNCVLSIVFWIKALKNHEVSVNKEFWKYGITLSVPLILHTVCMNILSQSDRIFISKICGSAETGIYSLAYSYGILISVITNAVSDGWLPWFHDNYYAKKYTRIRENTKWIVVLGCYVGLACVALAPEAIMILGGSKYESGITCVPPIVLGIVCQYIYTHYVNIEMHLKKTKYVSMGTVVAAILNIGLNAIFIPVYGYVAAAYTTLASYCVLMLIHFLITRMFLRIKLYDDLFMFGALGITIIVSIGISKIYKFSVLRYLIIAVGFVSFLFVYRRFIFAFIKNKILKNED